MDPSQAQSDTGNDSHSLENEEEGAKSKGLTANAPKNDDADDAKKNEDGTIDATGGSGSIDPKKVKKRSPLKRFWDRFNIYLMLFVLVLVIAVATVVFLTVKSKQAAQTTINSQELSQDALQQLANTDVTVGNPKQVLTVQANAVFAGAVLIRSNLEVAGTLKVGGNLTLASLTVSGATQLSDTQVNNLTVNGSLNLQGTLTLKNGISVAGASNFTGPVVATSIATGNLQLDGDLRLTHHIVAGGTIPTVARGTATGGGGTVSLSGSDTAGTITINTGTSPPAGCYANVTFSKKFANTPRVVVTPIGSAAASLEYYIERTTSGFSLCSLTSAVGGETFGFDYIALE